MSTFGKLEVLVECSILLDRLTKLAEAIHDDDAGRACDPDCGEVWALSADAVDWLDRCVRAGGLSVRPAELFGGQP